jgi:ABC-2 type transport system permease protein
MFRRIFTIAWKELLHLRKDRVLVPFLLIGAVAELTLLAWATTQPIDNIDMTVVDYDQSEQSTALINALDASPTLTYKRSAASLEAIYDLMDHNRTMVGLVIPKNYGADLIARKQPAVDLILNGTDSLSAFTAENAAQQIILEQGMRDAFHREPQDYAKELPKVTVKYNKDLKRSYYALPAEMGFMFYMMTLIMAAFAIARERERGTYEQLLVMPYRSWEVILGKILTPMAIGYGLFLTMLALTTLVFRVPLRGSLPLLLVLAVIYLTAEVGKGILFSMAARTQLQAVLLVTGVAMIDMVFSGYMVAVENMPRFMQTLSNFFSIRHWLVITRDIMLKGVGLEVFWPHMLAIVLLGIAIITVTAWQYRRSLR